MAKFRGHYTYFVCAPLFLCDLSVKQTGAELEVRVPLHHFVVPLPVPGRNGRHPPGTLDFPTPPRSANTAR